MKILIVDDLARRYERLVAALVAIGVDRASIEIVSCAQAARKHLEQTAYDVLVLDILLPLWPEDEPSVTHSLALLLELHEGDQFKRPQHILGITADRKVADEVRTQFDAWTWTIFEYSEANDEWMNRTINCVRYLMDDSRLKPTERSQHLVDLAVICALERPELEEVLKLPWNWQSARPLDGVTFIHDGHFNVGGRKITVVAAATSRMGMVSAALRSAALISHLHPRLIAMCGVCAGVREKVRIGDVLFADPAWDFQSGKRVRDKENVAFSIAPHQLSPAALIRSHVEQIRGDHAALSQLALAFGSDAPGAPRIVIGPVASGSAVLSDGKVIGEIKTQHRELIGVEMEIYGVYAAAHGSADPQPRAFALKAVCDFADPDKEDKHQRFAAYASANVLRLLMERFGPRLLD